MTLFQTLDIRPRDDERAEAQQTKMEHPQPISVIFPQIYPLLKRAAEVWIKDPDVMDTLSSVLKQVCAYSGANWKVYKYSLKKQKCQIQTGIAHYKNVATPLRTRGINTTHQHFQMRYVTLF